MITSKTIESDDLTAYERWELPLVNGPGASATAEELQTIQKQAYDEGFALGQKEGFEQKKQELEINAAFLRSMIEILSEPLKNLDEDIVNQLAELSMIVAKQVVRRELHTEQGEIVAIVREAMNALPASTRKITLNIHPDDVELIRNAFSLGNDNDSDELLWKVVEDPMITRGGCKISSENSRIDATVEARLNRVISTLLGGERESDES
ncbi:MAG: flagellar assembly protein FliH [Gammaproteobacteria bacterium]|nr:flagellar assembly protein FliH [Gammaproteobacteria bacterium]